MSRKISEETARMRYRTQAIQIEALRQKSISGSYPDSRYTDYVTCQGTQPGRLSGEGHKKCGKSVSMSFAFKCLYCSFWFCADCAEIHFGKTRAQHNEEERLKVVK